MKELKLRDRDFPKIRHLSLILITRKLLINILVFQVP